MNEYMVYSNINGTVFFKETTDIDPEDIGHETTIHEMEIHQKRILIVFGKLKHTFINRDVVYIPIYLVVRHKVSKQIGVIEMHKNDILTIFEESDNNEIDLDKLDEPLMFSFVDETFIDNSDSNADTFKPIENVVDGDIDKDNGVGNNDDEDKEYDETDDIMSVKVDPSKISKETKKAVEVLKNGVFEKDSNVNAPTSLVEESESDATEIKSAFLASPQNTWIEKYMKNNHYDVHDVENNGDCFFAVIRDAFKQIGMVTTVSKLRAILSREMTDDHFQDRRSMYNDLKRTIEGYDRELREMKERVDTVLRKQADEMRSDKNALVKIMEETNRVKEEYKKVGKRKQSANAIIAESVGKIQNIDTLEQFKEFIQTSGFWADEWAISVMERQLQVKFIVLSERAYLDGDLNNVMNCGMIDTQIQQDGTFKPTHYIMTTFSGDHYRLITYKSKRIFKFYELPYHIKALVVNKCLERTSGAFYVIPEVRALKSRMGIDEDEGIPIEDELDNTAIYDHKTIFEFYSNSSKSTKPGKGANEKIPSDKRSNFIDLSRITDWRRKLDDTWTDSPFELENKKWASVEHYYQASKFRKHNPDFAGLFSLDSTDSEIAKDVDLAISAGSKSGRASGKAKTKAKGTALLRPKGVEIDPDFYGERSELERIAAVNAKFSSEDMRQLLLATQDAKLTHYIRGSPSETDHILMATRHKLMDR